MKKIISLIIAPVLLLTLSSCVSYVPFNELTTRNEAGNSDYEYITQAPIVNVPENTTSIAVENTTAQQETLPAVIPETTAPAVQENTTSYPLVQPENTTAAPVVPEKDYSSFTKKQIIDEYSDALKKTRAYSGALTVLHTESFNADIKDAHPGGALTELLASNIVKLVGSEGQQTLNFNGGRATNSDGESVPILLPQRTDFSLPEEGVASASISQQGNKLHIKLVLVPETVSMGQVPHYNSSAIGYLDTSDMDFKIITISRVDIGYSGSVIDAVIRSDGYIESVTYTINMSTYAELSGMGITGYGTLEGAQTEKWQLQW